MFVHIATAFWKTLSTEDQTEESGLNSKKWVQNRMRRCLRSSNHKPLPFYMLTICWFLESTLRCIQVELQLWHDYVIVPDAARPNVESAKRQSLRPLSGISVYSLNRLTGRYYNWKVKKQIRLEQLAYILFLPIRLCKKSWHGKWIESGKPSLKWLEWSVCLQIMMER